VISSSTSVYGHHLGAGFRDGFPAAPVRRSLV
jgi:hypothetical protein